MDRVWRALAPALCLLLLPSPARPGGVIDDPLFGSHGSWGQSHEDQWALQRVGFTRPGAGTSAWEIATGAEQPVTVAVIDTGLDYLHPDLHPKNLWRNPGERLNGRDDDGNGYVDDVAGWNFVRDDNNPWDRCGHGTHIAGVIAAAAANGEGIVGINRGVRILNLKALNARGRGLGSDIAAAIVYAVEQGARVINLSLGSELVSRAERDAIAFAGEYGVVVVTAAGNAARDTSGYGIADLPHVLTVAASDVRDQRAGFSNWGRSVRISAPGVDVLSLRARFTDLLAVLGESGYVSGSAIVARRYYRASGTSFAVPFVSGVASLLFAKSPELTGEQVVRMLLHSARDIGEPGVDLATGFGLLDARAALRADPEYFVSAQLERVELRDGELAVLGSADASEFAGARLELARGLAAPAELVAEFSEPTRGVLALLAPDRLEGSDEWWLRLVSRHRNGRERESRHRLELVR